MPYPTFPKAGSKPYVGESGNSNVYFMDRIGFHNGRLRLGKTTISELRVKSVNDGTTAGLIVDGKSTLSGEATFSSGLRNSNLEVVTTTTAKDLTGITSDKLVLFTGAQAGNITLPQATANNVGLVITVAFGANASTTAFKLGFANSGSTTMIGQTTLVSNAGSEAVDGFVITASAKSFQIDADDVAAAGGAKGSIYKFTYTAANQVFCEARGAVTTGTPALAAGHSTTTGTA
jgi:hypothetical protein